MRYLLQKSFEHEQLSRKSFLYDSLKLWFFTTSDPDEHFLRFESMPNTCYSDVLMIIGHNYQVKEYLTSHDFTETLVVAITCDGGCNYKKLRLPGKNLFIPYQNNDNLVDLLSGKEFGLDFDVTESELQFYNSPKTWSLEKRIKQSFLSIEDYRRNDIHG